MSAIPMVYNESSFLRLLPATLTDGRISGLGTLIDIKRVVKVIMNPITTNASTETKYHTKDASNGNRYSVPDIGKNYNVLTGVEISDDSGGDANENFSCDVYLTFAERKTLLDHFRAGTPIFASRDIGKNSSNGLVAGYEYILGKIIEFKEAPEAGPATFSFSINADPTIVFYQTTPGTDDITFTQYNTAATGASKKITPDNTPELTIPDLITGDWDNIKLGKIVTKNL